MKVAIASDHRGYHLKEKVISLLKSKGHEVVDEGPSSDESVDYPDFAALVASKVSGGIVDRGILICGTGIGMASPPTSSRACGRPPATTKSPPNSAAGTTT